MGSESLMKIAALDRFGKTRERAPHKGGNRREGDEEPRLHFPIPCVWRSEVISIFMRWQPYVRSGGSPVSAARCAVPPINQLNGRWRIKKGLYLSIATETKELLAHLRGLGWQISFC